jgi:hypothetical protein
MRKMGRVHRWAHLVVGLMALVAGMWHVWGLSAAGAIVADVAVGMGLVLILMGLAGYSFLRGFPG